MTQGHGSSHCGYELSLILSNIYTLVCSSFLAQSATRTPDSPLRLPRLVFIGRPLPGLRDHDMLD